MPVRLGRAGNVAMMFAIAAIPLIGVMALAIDVGRVVWTKSRLDQAADSAALLVATVAANAYKAGDPNYLAEGKAAGQSRFLAETGSQPDLSSAAPVIGLSQNGGLFNATLSYSTSIASKLAGALGIAGFSISGQSAASLSFNPYADVQILMDVSSSMTLAATSADQTTMEQLTSNYNPTGPLPSNVSRGEACAFACHWTATQDDYYRLALRNDVQLRITVLKQAVGEVISSMQQQDQNSRFEVGLYTFSDVFNTVYPLSNDLGDASGPLGNVAPALNDCGGNCDNTDFDNAMGQMNSIDQALPQAGTNVPARFLFIITDGVYDDTRPSGRQIGPFNPNDCAALKALNVNILVLYTPYLPIPENSFWVDNVEPIQAQVQPNLQACASSPSYFFIANDATDIGNQLNAMFQLVAQSSSHLIQ